MGGAFWPNGGFQKTSYFWLFPPHDGGGTAKKIGFFSRKWGFGKIASFFPPSWGGGQNFGPPHLTAHFFLLFAFPQILPHIFFWFAFAKTLPHIFFPPWRGDITYGLEQLFEELR